MALPTVTRVSLSSPLNTTCHHRTCTQTLQTRTQPQDLAFLFTQDFQTLTTSPVFKQIFPEFYSQRTGRLKAEVTVDQASITVSQKRKIKRVTLLDISHQAQQSSSLPQFTRTHAEMVRKIHELYACHCSDASCTAAHSPQPLTGRATPYPSPIPSQYNPLRRYYHQHTSTQSDTSGDESAPRSFRPFHRTPSPNRREDELTCQLGRVEQQLADTQEELRATRFQLQRAQEETALLHAYATETRTNSEERLKELIGNVEELEGERSRLTKALQRAEEQARDLTHTLAHERADWQETAKETQDQLQRLSTILYDKEEELRDKQSQLQLVQREIGFDSDDNRSTQESVDATVAQLEHAVRELEGHRTHLLQEVGTLRTKLQTTQNSAEERAKAHVAELADLHHTHAAEKAQWKETADHLHQAMESAFASAAQWEKTCQRETERANQATREQESLLLELGKLREDNARKTAALEGSRAETAALETQLRETLLQANREIRVREAAQAALKQEKGLTKSLEEELRELQPLAERTTLVSKELKQSRQTAQQLEKELEKARAALRNSTDANAQILAQASTAEANVARLQKALAEKEQRVQILQLLNETASEALTKWQTHDADQTERAKGYADRLKAIRHREEKLEDALSESQRLVLQKTAELEQTSFSLMKTQIRLETAEGSRKRNEAKLDETHQDLERVNKALRAARETASTQTAALEATRQELEALRLEQRKQSEVLKASEEEKDKLTTQVQKLEQAYEVTQERVRELETMLNSEQLALQIANHRLENLQLELLSVSQDNTLKDRELTTLRQEQARAREEHAAQRQAHERGIKEKDLEIQRLLQELARLRAHADGLVALNAHLTSEFATKSKEIDLTKREIQASMQLLKKELETIQRQLAEKEREVVICTRDPQKQHSDAATETAPDGELQKALAEKAALEEQLLAKNAQLEEVARDLAQLQQNLIQLSQTYKRDNKALRERVSDLTAMLDEERSALEAMTYVAQQIADAASTFKPPVIEGDGLTTILTLLPETPRDTVILGVQNAETQTDELRTAPAETEMEEDQASSSSDSEPLLPLPESPPNTPRVEVPPLRLQEVQLVTARRVTAAEEVTAIQALHVVVERLGGLEIFVEGNLKHIFEVNSQLLRTNPNQIKRTQDQTATLTIWPAGEETEPVYVVRKPEGVRKLPPIREATSRGKVGAPETCRVVEFSEDAQRNQVNPLQLQLQGLAKEVQKYSPQTIDSYLPNVTRNCDLFTEACRTLTPKIEAFEGKVTTFQREWGVGETKGVMQALKTGVAPANTNGEQEAFREAFLALRKDYRGLQKETTQLIQSLAGMPGKHIHCMFLVNPAGAYRKEREFQRQFNALFELITVQESRAPARGNGTAALPESARRKERDPIDHGNKRGAPGGSTAPRVTARTNRSTVGTA